ncbi:hypothetical protein GMSM_04360 [Geomonas sp. Red276]
MSETESCTKPGEHKAHMCQLRAEGKLEEIDRHSKDPKFTCNRCGAEADEADYLCQPREL